MTKMEWVKDESSDRYTAHVGDETYQVYRAEYPENVFGGRIWASDQFSEISLRFKTSAEAMAATELYHQSNHSRKMIIPAVKNRHTPWGMANTMYTYAPGITRYYSNSHDGFELSEDRLRGMDPVLLAANDHYRWFEGDLAWSLVAMAYPEVFTPFECFHAHRIMVDYYPDAYMAYTKINLDTRDSITLMRREFLEENSDRLIALEYSKPESYPGFFVITATKGGNPHGGRREFLVPVRDIITETDPAISMLGFVIDESRYQEITAPAPGPQP